MKNTYVKTTINQLKNKQRGITLIALVITIIVLLVLAGVTINMVVGQNGIFTKATTAKEETKAKNIEEEIQMMILENEALKYPEDRSKTDADLKASIIEKLKSDKLITDENDVITINGSTKKVSEIIEGKITRGSTGEVEKTQSYKSQHPEEHIPTGFTHKEGTVEEGYVIKDADGNEFVWIPVASSADYTKKLGTNNWGVKEGSTGEDTVASLEKNITKAVQGDTLGVSNILGTSVTSTLADKPEASIVNEAGGFWVGRYEAGVESTERKAYIAEIPEWSNTEYTESNKYWTTGKEITVKAGNEPVRTITQSTSLELANNWKRGEADAEKGTVAFQSGLITGTRLGCNV